MSLSQQETQLVNNFLIGFSQDVDHTILTILFGLIIQDEAERDDILVKCYDRYIDATQPFLDQMSKGNLGFGLVCRNSLAKFVLSQLKTENIIEEFKKKAALEPEKTSSIIM